MKAERGVNLGPHSHHAHLWARGWAVQLELLEILTALELQPVLGVAGSVLLLLQG